MSMEEAAQQSTQQMASMVRALIEITRALQAARQGRPTVDSGARQPVVDDRYAQAIATAFGPEVRHVLTNSPEWSRIATQLRELEGGGIAPDQLLGTLAQITRQAVPQQAGRPGAERAVGGEQYARTHQLTIEQLREQVGDRSVAEALTGSPEWPRIATQLEDLRRAGVDISRLSPELSRVYGVPPAPAVATAEPSRPPRTRAEALEQQGISAHESDRLVRVAREGAGQRLGDLLAASQGWPQVATALRDLEQQGIDPCARLASLQQETMALASRRSRPDVAQAALAALARPAPAVGEKTPVPDRAAVVVPERAVESAAKLAGQRGVLSADMLMSEGTSAREAGRLLTELEARGIIGGLAANGVHPARVDSADVALDRLKATRERARTAAAAGSTSTTVAQGPRTGGPAAEPAATSPTSSVARPRRR